VNIPTIAVFTKYDLLVTQFWRQDNQPWKSKRGDAEKNASDSFDRFVKELQKLTDLSLPCVKVSTTDINARRLFISPLPSLSIDTTHITEMLIDLVNETYSMLHGVEDKLSVFWVAAQQIDVRQKVEVCIR